MKRLSKKIKQFIVCLMFLSVSTQAQEVYFSTGLNLTTYDFKGTDNLPLEFKTKSSSFYEIGYVFKLMDNKLHYSASLAINGFDAIAGDSANHYEWQTTYMGLNNQLHYIVIPSYRMPFELSVGAQMQLLHIINGEQKINGETFDLTKEKEFSGFWVQPGGILTAKYFISDDWQMSLGYNYSIGMNLSNSTEEKLKFNNQQIRFGIHFNIN